MTRRLNNWLENHYVVVVSSLISSIIVCLAVLAGLEARRTPHPQAWAMRPAEAGKVPAEAPPRVHHFSLPTRSIEDTPVPPLLPSSTAASSIRGSGGYSEVRLIGRGAREKNL